MVNSKLRYIGNLIIFVHLNFKLLNTPRNVYIFLINAEIMRKFTPNRIISYSLSNGFVSHSHSNIIIHM